MTERGMEALTAERATVLALAGSLTEDEWAAPSACDGWRVQDVIAHLANTFRMAVDPGSLPASVAGDLEATQAVHAAAHREWSPDRVLSDYEDMAGRAIEMFAGFQGPAFADVDFPMDNAGRYPLHLLPDVFTFDHFCHLRNDILRPDGPVERDPLPADDLRLGVTVRWMLTSLPQMGADALAAAVTAPVGVRLTGPGGGEWTIRPAVADRRSGGDRPLVSVKKGIAPDVQATATSSGFDLVIWGTWRRPWRECGVTIEGDEAVIAPVLDQIHVF